MNMNYLKRYTIIGIGLLVSGFSAGADDFGATDVKVDDNGVVVNLDDEKSLDKLPTVYYDGTNPDAVSGTTVYQGGDAGVEVIEDGTTYIYNTTGSIEHGVLNLSIDQAEMMAINYSPTFKQALTQKMGAKGQRIEAIGGALPSVGLSASTLWSQSRKLEYNEYAGHSSTPTPAGRNTSAYSVDVSQPLFQGGAIISAIRASKLYDDWVSEDIKVSRQAVIRTLRTQYYNTQYYEKLVEIYNDQAQIAKEYWEKTKRRYEADDVAEIEVLKYQVQYKIAEAQYIRAKSEYDVYRVNVLRLIGAPLDTKLTLTTPFDFKELDPGSVDSLTAEALASRPEIKASKLNEAIQKENIKQAKSGLYPELSAVASWGQTNRFSGASSSSTLGKRGTDWTWSAGFEMSWNVLAGGGQLVRGQIIQAKAILDSYEFATEDTIDDIKEEVKASVLTLLSSIDWVKSQKENVTQAERVLKQETIKWDEGAGDYLDILDARDSLAQSQQLYWEGVATYNISLVDLEYSIGKYQNETNTTVQGYKVVKKAPVKLKKRTDKFSHKDIENSLKALAVPEDLVADDTTASNSAVANKQVSNGYNMQVEPAHVDRNVVGSAKKQIQAAPAKEDSDIAGPKLFF